MARFGLLDYLLGGGAAAPTAPAMGDQQATVDFGGGAVAPPADAGTLNQRSAFGQPLTNIPYGFGGGDGGFGARPAVAPSTAQPVRGLKLSAADLRAALDALTKRLAASKPGRSGFGRPQDWQAAQLQAGLQKRDPTAESFVAGLQQKDPQTLAFAQGIANQDPDTLRFIAMLQGR